MPFIWWLSVWHTGYQRMRLRMTWIRRDKCSTMHDCFYGLLNWKVSHWGWITYWSTLVSPEQNWQCHSVRVISWTWYQTGWFMGSTWLCLSLGKSCQLWLWAKMSVGCLQGCPKMEQAIGFPVTSHPTGGAFGRCWEMSQHIEWECHDGNLKHSPTAG